MPTFARTRHRAARLAHRAALLGPGLLVMLADCDAGNVLVAAQAGAIWGYLLLPVFAALAPLLYWTQQASADLGRRTGLGFGEAIRARFGAPFARASAAALALSCLATLITEMTGIAGAGSVFGVPGAVSLVPAAALVAFTAAGGRARRLDALVVGIGLFEASFAAMAWLAHPDFSHWARTWQAVRLDDPRLVAMAAAIVGATFNPWMLFYQQHAVARARRRGEAPAPAASRAETALGALLGQGFTMSIVVIVAATAHAAHRPLSTLGELAAVFVGIAGPGLGYPLFAGGMLASAFVAAVVCLEALVAGSAELLPALRPAHTAWLGPLAIAASALVACGFDDPVGSSVAVQAASGLVSAGFIVVLFKLRANRAKAVRVA